MDIDRKLLGRAAALLSEARDMVQRVQSKIEPSEDDQTVDDDKEDLIAIVDDIEQIIPRIDRLAKEEN